MAARDAAGGGGDHHGGSELWGGDVGEVAAALLSSAVRCFAAAGFHATTTRDICAGAGLSPAALYVHFPSKEHVLFEVTRRGHRSALAVVDDPAIARLDDTVARLHTTVSRFVAWHARHHVAARVCQYELAALTAPHATEIRDVRRRFNSVFREAVGAAAPSTVAPDDVDRVVRAIFSLGIDLVRWYRLDGGDDPDRLGEFYAGLTLRMIGAD